MIDASKSCIILDGKVCPAPNTVALPNVFAPTKVCAPVKFA